MSKGIKDKVAILGMGCAKFGERWEDDAEDLMVEAYTEALADAGIETSADRRGLAFGRLRRDEHRPVGHPARHGPAVAQHPGHQGRELLRLGHRSPARRRLRGRLGCRGYRPGARRREAEGHGLRRPPGSNAWNDVRHDWRRRFSARQLRATGGRLPREARHREGGPQARHGACVGQEPRQRRKESQGAPAQARRHGDRTEGSHHRRAARPVRLLRRLRRCGLRDRHDAGDRPQPRQGRRTRHDQGAATGGVERRGNCRDRAGTAATCTRPASRRAAPTRKPASRSRANRSA